MPTSPREEVLALFEKHRAKPGSEFRESHFLDYLLSAPARKGAIRNSFAGLRRYNAFIEEVQLHFAICFGVKDFDSNYSLGEFLVRVQELQGSPKSSLSALRNQLKRGFGWGTVVLLNFVAVVVLVALWRLHPVALWIALGVWLIANALLVRFYLRWRSYRSDLLLKLGGTASGA